MHLKKNLSLYSENIKRILQKRNEKSQKSY